MSVLSLHEATRRLRTDRRLLLDEVADLSDEELAAEYRVASGPLGDFCTSLHDLVAHVLMWDEINLAVLSEAAAGREHWSLDDRWSTADIGRRLNLGGVEAGRHLPGSLLLHRFRTVHAALLDELGRLTERTWTEPGPTPSLAEGLGSLAQREFSVPGRPAYCHAAIHLDRLAAVVGETAGAPYDAPAGGPDGADGSAEVRPAEGAGR